MKDIIRFINFIDRNNGCWEWQGALDKDSYGWFSFKGKNCKAHRASYKLFVGKLDSSLQIDHLCRNRRCVNPHHLEQVSARTNTLRSPIAPAAINARKTHCKNGHEFTPINTLVLSTTGDRACRTCQRESKAKYRAKRKALGLPYI